jgi:hypothetical protein
MWRMPARLPRPEENPDLSDPTVGSDRLGYDFKRSDTVHRRDRLERIDELEPVNCRAGG